MITYSALGAPTSGRLGNSLFQIASTIGIARAHNTSFYFPRWSYEKYFIKPISESQEVFTKLTDVREVGYHFGPIPVRGDTNVHGWLQTSKYWKHCDAEVRDRLRFKPEVIRPLFEPNGKQTIAISIRRGDFVGNPNYYQLPITYYILALLEHFPNFEDYNIIFFSDDLGYCKVNFECMPNAYFPESHSDIEQLALMSTCDHFIISNSTFSWWGAYLGKKEHTKVIRPLKNLAGMLEQKNSERDYWEPEWTVFDHENKKIDLSDFTFTIPVFYDHEDRKQNVNLAVSMLLKHYHTNIMVGEQGGQVFAYLAKYCRYLNFKGMTVFHRTQMLNIMARRSTTKYVVNYDADILTPPMQFVIAQRMLNAGADFVYPYDGRFARVNRAVWLSKIANAMDIGIVSNTEFKGKHGKPLPISSVGGVVIVNKESFIDSGLENEYMVSYAPEDCERWDRWHMLGYNVKRVLGCVYHIDHWIGVNSSSRNPYFKESHELLNRIREMSKEQLKKYVDSWPWKNENN